jgi:hypothetical protein
MLGIKKAIPQSKNRVQKRKYIVQSLKLECCLNLKLGARV